MRKTFALFLTVLAILNLVHAQTETEDDDETNTFD